METMRAARLRLNSLNCASHHPAGTKPSSRYPATTIICAAPNSRLLASAHPLTLAFSFLTLHFVYFAAQNKRTEWSWPPGIRGVVGSS